MGIRRRGKKGTFLFEMRVPKQFRDVEPREFVRQSLKTDSEALAAKKEARARELLLARWEALQAGRIDDAERYQKAVVDLCRASGFDYLPSQDVARLSIDALADRVQAAKRDAPVVHAALLGGEDLAEIHMSDLLERFEDVVEADLVRKDLKQKRKWRADRQRVIDEFIDECGDMDIRDVSREAASKYRRALSDRLVEGELVYNSANRRIMALGKMHREVLWDRYAVRSEAFKEMGWREPKQKRRPTQVSYSTGFISGRLLAPGALDALNVDAADALRAIINTGISPSELVNLNASTIHLDHSIPHIAIRPHGRELKNVYRERDIPIVGVSLEAFERHPNGFVRYDNGDSLSNLVNKYLRNNDLKETPEHTLKSLRHAFRDRLRNTSCPDSVAEELMGHEQDGTVYGEGVWLGVARDVLLGIAL